MIRISCNVTADCSRDPRSIDCLPKKAAGTERGLSKGEAVHFAGGRPGSIALLKPTGDQIMPPKAPDVGNGATWNDVHTAGFFCLASL